MTFSFAYNYPQVARDSGFKLRNYKDGPLDWRLIGSMEIERILNDQSFEQIDAVLNHLSEVPLGSILDSNILDSGIAKYFMLSQFSVQYLIFCRKFLEETVTDLRESNSSSQIELATLKRSLSEANNEILQLHKKITQMEAIHEVIYPCHLCTKNFVSNDALNLHISRKHSMGLEKPEKKFESQQSLSKDGESDLTLINTIKLELEIKQLKERLNIAEREIKEKYCESEAKSARENGTAVLEKCEQISVRSIGIQSNLSEIKEKDDSREEDLCYSSKNSPLLCMLHDKLQEFEKWKDEQKYQNSEFLVEINSKIQEISTALETTRTDKYLQIDNEKQKSASSSVEDLETLLAKKVEEISKATADNIESVVKKIELSYNDKILQLEKELIKLNKQYSIEKAFKSNEIPPKVDDNINYLEGTTTQPKHKEVNDHNPDRKIITEGPLVQPKDEYPPKDASLSESNHTFVKYCNVIAQSEKNSNNYDNSAPTSGMSDDDSTDVSSSLFDEGHVEKPDKESVKTVKNTSHIYKGKIPRLHGQHLAKPKTITKKEAKKLTNARLSSFGVDNKTKTLTSIMKKQILDDLNDRNKKLKQKQPQFYATRNKIKNFVDKLCSTKMPPNAKALLKITKNAEPKIQNPLNDDEHSLSESEEPELIKASTPLNENPKAIDSDNFKQRLERILASPIRKPDDHIIKAIVHREDKKPVPIPRKRVLFNHPEVQERHLSFTESDEHQ